jgi:hypothetical protein
LGRGGGEVLLIHYLDDSTTIHSNIISYWSQIIIDEITPWNWKQNGGDVSCQTSYIITHNVIMGTDCIGSNGNYKANYHTITVMTAPPIESGEIS